MIGKVARNPFYEILEIGVSRKKGGDARENVAMNNSSFIKKERRC